MLKSASRFLVPRFCSEFRYE